MAAQTNKNNKVSQISNNNNDISIDNIENNDNEPINKKSNVVSPPNENSRGKSQEGLVVTNNDLNSRINLKEDNEDDQEP